MSFQQLDQILAQVHDLKMASAVLSWDQLTYMPKNGATMRGRQLATLGKLAHEKFVSQEVKELLASMSDYGDKFEYHSYEASLLRFASKEYNKATKFSSKFISDLLQHQSKTYDTWILARAQNNFKLIEPLLEKTLIFSKEYAKHFEYEHIADPLIAESDEGFTVKELRKIFKNLKDEIKPILEEVMQKPSVDDSFLKKYYPLERQERFNHYLVEKIGYDFARGRVDTTHHPFMTTFSHGDVRITTRYDENYLAESLFSSIHEMGHAFYELGVDSSLDGTFLYGGTSSGVHESQSRLWENIVARSENFWTHFFPILQKTFPENLANITSTKFYKAINKVNPSFIRTDADELTYNLHVMIRFELELNLLEGNLKVSDLPAAWNELYKNYLGINVLRDSEGCLQDVHWFSSLIGGQFQGYALGNIMSAQFFDAAINQNSSIENSIREGDFGPLKSWLGFNLHQHGKKYTGLEVLKMATGQNLQIEPYVKYLKRKFTA